MSRTSQFLTIRIQGAVPSQRLEYQLPINEAVRVGRAPKQGWMIAWDLMISREHADLIWDGSLVHVRLTSKAQNPVLYRGQKLRELSVRPGDWFQIGGTTFQAGEEAPTRMAASPGIASDTSMFEAADQRGYKYDELRQIAFQNTDQRMEILSEVPAIIRRSRTDEELCLNLSRVLLSAMPQAEAVAVVQFDMASLPADVDQLDSFPKPITMRVETRARFDGRFQTSRRMVWLALKREESLIHISGGGAEKDGGFTLSEGLRWSFCCPIRGEATRGWCVYVSGNKAPNDAVSITEEDLAPDLRFTELVSQFIGSIRQVRALQEQRTRLSTFFSPKVMQSLSDAVRSQELLAPAERSVTVLFCDVHGFSRKCEQLQGDLLRLLQSVSSALGVMAGAILENDGTIADFQGDAALGFWGWPVEASDGPLPACRAALQIYREFRQGAAEAGGLLDGFSVGLGIAHGRALAGQIGTSKQAKVGVFGPVANLGSRLEGLTRHFGVPICVDEATAHCVRASLPPEQGRVRKLGRVRPKGMEGAVTVYGLTPPEADDPGVTSQLLAQYDEAVEDLNSGNWDHAMHTLHMLPASDGPTQFLLRLMAEHNYRAPEQWNGAFSLGDK